ncbi:hypothetical protein I5976_17805 [Clostridioides difficile]|uniref:hypothetical protein n=1 Tax=Clostridioides difficile TaxID=1496 RepID=UPI0008A60562|nr:hypothetical protein [Clostridioides difficile]OFU26252.1 hypothetical protein HMPREF3075_18120 [Clostridium sp. HMSC19B11]EGT3846081.1 hypothetical protein [Clostridioides difficile]EGT4697937.1 hypothetical protein [Clostridioides difficile]EGT4823316.1 hypothetical protein [Clostridioides difficile]EGT4914698.1 hypothetical protein [Clostridioides difficile]
MFKKAKRIITLAAMISMVGGSILIGHADEENTYSPETGELPYQGLELNVSPTTRSAEPRTYTYKYSGEFKNYTQSGAFVSTGRQKIIDGYQRTKTATASTGVQYQIITKQGSKLKYVTRTGVYNGNLSIDLSHNNTVGSDRKLRLANYYNLSFDDPNAPVQSASGQFNYLY